MTIHTTYTVLSASGDILAVNCTADEAASQILTYDGYAFEIRRGEPKSDVAGKPWWDLWHSDGSTNSPRGAAHLVRTNIGVYAATEEAAWAAIAKEVILYAHWFKGCTAMADADYAAMVAEDAAEQPNG